MILIRDILVAEETSHAQGHRCCSVLLINGHEPDVMMAQVVDQVDGVDTQGRPESGRDDRWQELRPVHECELDVRSKGIKE